LGVLRTLLHRVVITGLLCAAESAAAEEGGQEPSPEQPSPERAPRAAAPAASTVPAPRAAETSAPAAPSFRFKLYSDVNFVLREREHASFQIGAVDFFITGDISEDFSVVSENVLKILGDRGTVFDLDRIYLEWHPQRWFKVRFGRDHLMFGRYLQTYHHPLLFQLATSRPAAVAFEDEGGLLATHQIGVEALGDVPIGEDLELRYAIGIGNGRGQYSGDILSTRDRNAFKALVAQVGLLPRFLPGFEFGVSGYLDRIPPGLTDVTGRFVLSEAIDEQIIGAHILYTSDAIEAHAEGYFLAHRARNTGLTSHLMGGFAQLGVIFAPWTPYVRVEGVKRSVGDNFYSLSGTLTRLFELRAGIRYGLGDRAVLKLEYRREFENQIHGAALQAAFGI
jgi:hypothetical protein